MIRNKIRSLTAIAVFIAALCFITTWQVQKESPDTVNAADEKILTNIDGFTDICLSDIEEISLNNGRSWYAVTDAADIKKVLETVNEIEIEKAEDPAKAQEIVCGGSLVSIEIKYQSGEAAAITIRPDRVYADTAFYEGTARNYTKLSDLYQELSESYEVNYP